MKLLTELLVPRFRSVRKLWEFSYSGLTGRIYHGRSGSGVPISELAGTQGGVVETRHWPIVKFEGSTPAGLRVCTPSEMCKRCTGQPCGVASSFDASIARHEKPTPKEPQLATPRLGQRTHDTSHVYLAGAAAAACDQRCFKMAKP